MSDLTVSKVFSEQIPSRLKEDPDKAKALGGVYQFNVTGDGGGNWCVDLTVPEVREEKNDGAQCTIEVEDQDFLDIVTGTLPGPQAFMMGKLRIEGDMALAMKLGEVLGA